MEKLTYRLYLNNTRAKAKEKKISEAQNVRKEKKKRNERHELFIRLKVKDVNV